MSTRCQIGFSYENNENFMKPDVLIYRHSDGYPEGILPDLIPDVLMFAERRGLDDIEYFSAWMLYALIEKHVEWGKKYVADSKKTRSTFCDDSYPADGKNCCGFGICNDFHGDIDYYYFFQGKNLTVYKVSGACDSLENFEPFLKYEFKDKTFIQVNPKTGKQINKGKDLLSLL